MSYGIADAAIHTIGDDRLYVFYAPPRSDAFVQLYLRIDGDTGVFDLFETGANAVDTASTDLECTKFD